MLHRDQKVKPASSHVDLLGRAQASGFPLAARDSSHWEGPGKLAFRQGVLHSAYRQYLQLPISVSSWSISAVPYLLIFYHFSCLTCPSFPVINSCLTPVSVEHLWCSSAEGWVAAVSAGKAVSVCVPFGKH